MANKKHVEILLKGICDWEQWRDSNKETIPDLSEADLSRVDLTKMDFCSANLWKADLSCSELGDAKLSGAQLGEADLSRANLKNADLREADLFQAVLVKVNLRESNLVNADIRGANLSGANLIEANLSKADLRGADLRGSDLRRAKLIYADLSEANLSGVDLRMVDLEGANLKGCNLECTRLIDVNIEDAVMSECRVYGISVWNLHGTPKDQSGLIITANSEPRITVDDLEVAQFIYLLLNREKLRNVISTITSKAVLILGRFTPEQKLILDSIANELRKNNLLPIIFDFERCSSRDFTETIKTLVGLSFFVIVDITNPKSTPLELQATVPDYQIPFIPILRKGYEPFSMFINLMNKHDWLLKPLIEYRDQDQLLQCFNELVIDRAWVKHQELQKKKANELDRLLLDDYLGKKQKGAAL